MEETARQPAHLEAERQLPTSAILSRLESAVLQQTDILEESTALTAMEIYAEMYRLNYGPAHRERVVRIFEEQLRRYGNYYRPEVAEYAAVAAFALDEPELRQRVDDLYSGVLEAVSRSAKDLPSLSGDDRRTAQINLVEHLNRLTFLGRVFADEGRYGDVLRILETVDIFRVDCGNPELGFIDANGPEEQVRLVMLADLVRLDLIGWLTDKLYDADIGKANVLDIDNQPLDANEFIDIIKRHTDRFLDEDLRLEALLSAARAPVAAGKIPQACKLYRQSASQAENEGLGNVRQIDAQLEFMAKWFNKTGDAGLVDELINKSEAFIRDERSFAIVAEQLLNFIARCRRQLYRLDDDALTGVALRLQRLAAAHTEIHGVYAEDIPASVDEIKTDVDESNFMVTRIGLLAKLKRINSKAGIKNLGESHKCRLEPRERALIAAAGLMGESANLLHLLGRSDENISQQLAAQLEGFAVGLACLQSVSTRALDLLSSESGAAAFDFAADLEQHLAQLKLIGARLDLRIGRLNAAAARMSEANRLFALSGDERLEFLLELFGERVKVNGQESVTGCLNLIISELENQEASADKYLEIYRRLLSDNYRR